MRNFILIQQSRVKFPLGPCDGALLAIIIPQNLTHISKNDRALLAALEKVFTFLDLGENLHEDLTFLLMA